MSDDSDTDSDDSSASITEVSMLSNVTNTKAIGTEQEEVLPDTEDEVEVSEVQQAGTLQAKPTSRKRKRDTKDDETNNPPTKKNIAYMASIFSVAEMRKPVSKRAPKSGRTELSSDEPWDTLKAQILVLISTALDPEIIDFGNYDITATIPRLLPKPGVDLGDESDYQFLLKNVQKSKAADLIVNLAVIEKASEADKENEGTGGGDEPKSKKAENCRRPKAQSSFLGMLQEEKQ
ncbi:hypothetical protein DENSPDRAFT_891416 [Dentipellis sp. KUC8613]|nr:hypothetical protein DENSPDRAFT_891416 [Dentipellis sp. KUC8613]